MEPTIVVSNTTPLIAFAWLEQLQILPTLFEKIYIPQAVRDELLANPEKIGVSELRTAAWLHVLPVENRLAVDILNSELDAGESEAIVLAHQMSARLLLMDERRGRRRAVEGNLVVTGTLGILVEARRRKLIGPLQPLLDHLLELPFRMSHDLYAEILRQVGESK